MFSAKEPRCTAEDYATQNGYVYPHYNMRQKSSIFFVVKEKLARKS